MEGRRQKLTRRPPARTATILRLAVAVAILLFCSMILSYRTLHDHLSNEDHFNVLSRGRDDSHSILAVVVLSAHASVERRDIIRSTWGKRGCVFFVVGQCGDHCNFDLKKENTRFGDVILIPEPDNYGVLPEKLLFAYQTIVSSMPHVKWIAKADDDTYVRVNDLEIYLQKFNSDRHMLLGNIKARTPVSRSGKWAEQSHHYAKLFYPPWPLGSAGHVVSRSAAQVLSDHSRELKRYQGEDVSLGIWLDELMRDNITYVHAPSLFTNDVRGGDACRSTTDYLMIGHNLTLSQLQSCFQSDQTKTRRSIGNVWLDEPVDFESAKWNRVGNFIGAGTQGGGASLFGKEALAEQQKRAMAKQLQRLV